MNKNNLIVFIAAFCLGGLFFWLISDNTKNQDPAPSTDSGFVRDAVANGARDSVSGNPLEAKLPTPSKTVDSVRSGVRVEVSNIVDFSVDMGRDNYEGRFWEITQLGEELTDEEIAALSEFLFVPYDSQRGLSLLEYNSLKNEIMGKLVNLGSERVDAAGIFRAIFRDTNLDEVIRDYAVQFSYHLFEESELLRESVVYDSTLSKEALKQTKSTIAGTALLGEARLSKANPERFSKAQVAAYAWSILNDKSSIKANQVSSLSVLASVGDSTVIPRAREILEQEQVGISTVAAMGALRELGDKASIPLIKPYMASTNPSVSRAARHTVSRLNEM